MPNAGRGGCGRVHDTTHRDVAAARASPSTRVATESALGRRSASLERRDPTLIVIGD
jgi:hypothetical protein